MKFQAVFCLCMCLYTVSARNAFKAMFPVKYPPMLQNNVDPGEPLFLTPYIKKGQIDQARTLSQVGSIPGVNVKSFSGFFTVNETTNSNMFFWFFPAQTNTATAPVVLWLQGGPGGSSLFGLFVENGPLMVTKDTQVLMRDITWNTKYSMLYIDNPVGTGFSFTKMDSGYATNEEDVARDLYSCLTQFFTVFPEYQKNEFYATGESYAGKYVPAISYKIHTENPTASLKINFQGMAIGDGLCDPETMMGEYATFMYSVGLLDENQRKYFQAASDLAVKYIQQEQWMKAFQIVDHLDEFFTKVTGSTFMYNILYSKTFDSMILGDNSYFNNATGMKEEYNLLRTTIFDSLLNGDVYPYPSYFYNVSGTHNYYNFLMTEEPAAFNYYGNLLAMPSVRKAIHVGSLTYNDGEAVEKHLLNDMMQSVKPKIATIMENYKVMFYNGQLDIIIPVPMSEAFIRTVQWSKQSQYLSADRMIWKINPNDTEVAGYVRQVDNFYQVVVRGSGHILPYDQPARGYDMIQRFIENRSFS